MQICKLNLYISSQLVIVIHTLPTYHQVIYMKIVLMISHFYFCIFYLASILEIFIYLYISLTIIFKFVKTNKLKASSAKTVFDICYTLHEDTAIKMICLLLSIITFFKLPCIYRLGSYRNKNTTDVKPKL